MEESSTMSIVSLIFSLIFIILQIIGLWKIFEKSGEKGWKAIIPIYNAVVLLQISGLSGLKYFGLAILFAIANIIPIVGQIIFIVGTIWLAIFTSNKLSKSFGKGNWFTVGLIFIPAIMYIVLGFGSAEYVGTNYKELKEKVA